MTDQTNYKIINENGTRQLANAFSNLVEVGDILLLSGDLGAGKSFFSRCLIRTLADDPELDVPSPTFALVQPYQFKDFSCLHADLYRMSDESEAEELGLFDGKNLMLVEWPDRLPELAQEARFALKFENIVADAEGRKLTITALSEDLNKLAALLESRSDIIVTN